MEAKLLTVVLVPIPSFPLFLFLLLLCHANFSLMFILFTFFPSNYAVFFLTHFEFLSFLLVDGRIAFELKQLIVFFTLFHEQSVCHSFHFVFTTLSFLCLPLFLNLFYVCISFWTQICFPNGRLFVGKLLFLPCFPFWGWADLFSGG